MNEMIVKNAEKELGVKESPANSNKTKYGEWFGWDGVAWCGIFVSYIYHKSGFPLKKLGFTKGFAGCQIAVQIFTERKETTQDPVPGDIVFFDWNDDKRYDHTGIFVKWLDYRKEKFQSIEGNTSLTNQSNGGEVMIRNRKNNSVIFVHPKILDIA